jgi:hypothetical protein
MIQGRGGIANTMNGQVMPCKEMFLTVIALTNLVFPQEYILAIL